MGYALRRNMKNIIITTIALLVLIMGCSNCSSGETPANIRTEDCINYCPAACDKMQKLYDEGDASCYLYIEVILVDGKDMTCKDFCSYECNNSINLEAQCIVEQVNSCSEIIEKCEQ
jgi:hypothetical protein